MKNPPTGGFVFTMFGVKPSYLEIIDCVKQRFGFVPKTCWIAHVKELNGLKPRIAHNRFDSKTRLVPCPENKRAAIEDCMRRLGLIGQK
jgi:hypothetical protein